MEKEYISIIIPAYNNEEFLRGCFDSIRRQTFADFEVIIVDDGSTDDSAVICQEFIDRDSRFKYVKKENGGVSSARNFGLKQATGQYVTFIDSDDTIEEEHLALMIDSIRAHDLAITGYNELGRRNRTWIFGQDKTVHKKELISLLLKNRSVWGISCNKLYRKEIIDKGNLSFIKNIKHGEDLVFNMEYALLADSAYISNKATYNYIHHSTNTTGKINTRDKFEIGLTHLDALKLSLFLLPENYLEEEDFLVRCIAESGSYCYQIATNLKIPKKSASALNIDPYIKKYLFRNMNYPKFEFRATVSIILNRYFPRISGVIYRCF